MRGVWIEVGAPDAGTRAAVAALVERAAERDGIAALSDDGRRALAGADTTERATPVHVVARRAGAVADRERPGGEPTGGEVLGYAVAFGPPVPQGAEATLLRSAELVVDPAARGGGVGSLLLATVRDHGYGGENEPVAVGGAGAVGIWAHGDLPAARALAVGAGLRPRRELLRMRAPLDGLPEPRPVSGVRLCGFDGWRAEVGGARADAALLRVNAASFAWHPEQGHWGMADLAVRRAEDWYDPAGLIVAVPEDGETDGAHGPALSGFHWTKTHGAAAEPGALGEVYVVAVAPEAQGRGLGGALTLAGLRHLRGRGYRAAILYVEGDNAPAIATYRRLGFVVETRDVVYG